METRAERAAEAYRRGLMGPNTKARYEEAVKRGIVNDNFASGRLESKSGVGVLSAMASTINEAVPGLDEITAGASAVVDTLSGRGNLKETWRANRDYQSGQQAGLLQDRPNTANLMTGTGYAIQAVPALATGGATVAPQLAQTGGRTLTQRALTKGGELMMTGARNATVGAAYAYGNVAGGRGDGMERVSEANKAIPIGAAAGVVLPPAVGALTMTGRKAGGLIASGGRTTARAVNAAASKSPTGPLLDPEKQVLNRLTEALRKDRLTPEQIIAATDEWNRVGGPSPAFMDIVSQNGGGQNTMALVRGAGMSGSGRNAATQYGAKVSGDLQDVAIERTRALTADARSLPAIEADVTRRIATNSNVPEVASGSGGQQVSQRLNASYDDAKRGVDQAYAAARATDPQAAHLQAQEMPRISASLREAVSDVHPQDAPSVTRILGDLDRLSAPTMRDLFEARSHLTSLRMTPDAQGVAAGRAVRALDAEINAAAEQGLITGDPAVVGQWRAAIAARREFGRDFEGDDLIAQLTERGMRGAGRTNIVAAEDATNAMIGRNGVNQRPDMIRDLTRLRDRLGADSPEWNAFRQEAQSRVMGKDAGSENFGQAFDGFRRQSPQLADLLFTPQEVAALGQARGNIAAAVADREAVATGRSIMNTPSADFRVSMTGVGERQPLAQVGAARSVEGMIERPPEGATGVLNRLGSSTRATNNLRETFGEAPAGDYQAAIRNTVDQVNNARFINPNTNSETAGRLVDEGLVSIPDSKASLVKMVLDKFRSGATLTDQEREILVRIATGRAEVSSDRILPRLAARQPITMTGRPVSPVLAAPMAQENRR